MAPIHYFASAHTFLMIYDYTTRILCQFLLKCVLSVSSGFRSLMSIVIPQLNAVVLCKGVITRNKFFEIYRWCAILVVIGMPL